VTHPRNIQPYQRLNRRVGFATHRHQSADTCGIGFLCGIRYGRVRIGAPLGALTPDEGQVGLGVLPCALQTLWRQRCRRASKQSWLLAFLWSLLLAHSRKKKSWSSRSLSKSQWASSKLFAGRALGRVRHTPGAGAQPEARPC